MDLYRYHRPVLAERVVDYLVTLPEGIYVDCTVGGAGHARFIAERIGASGKLVCLDADTDAIHYAKSQLGLYPNVMIKQAYFDQLDVILDSQDLLPVQGFLFDLGISSFQVDSPTKGFSYQADGPLDMRFDRRQRLSAREVVNQYTQAQLEQILWKFGEEIRSRKIASRIIEARQQSAIESTAKLREIVEKAVSPRMINKTLSRVFQAIRIEVNDELGRLSRALQKAFTCLNRGGRIAVISYHSLEDRIVKDFFREKERDCICPPELPECRCDKVSEMKILTRKPVLPGKEEIRENPRSRSAKLRVAEKIVDYKVE